MQFSVTITAPNMKELRMHMLNAANGIEAEAVTGGTTAPAAEGVRRPGRPVKAAAPAATEEDFDLGETDTVSDDAPATTIENVMDAFKTYTKDNGKDAAIKILKAYKVKSVRDIPAAQWPSVLEKLAA